MLKVLLNQTHRDGVLNKPRKFMKTLMQSFLALFLTTSLLAAEKPAPPPAPPAEIVFRELRYDAKVSEDKARFTVDITAESTGKGEAVVTLFEGELALLPPKLPDGLHVERDGNVYRLFITCAGKHQFKFDVVAKITRAEPWNQAAFKGPLAAIASVNAQASGADVDLQLLTGTVIESVQTNNLARVRGFLGAESQLSLRWQSRAAACDPPAISRTLLSASVLVSP